MPNKVNSKKLEEASKGDYLYYLQTISYTSNNIKIIFIPSGSILEILSIRRNKSGLCTMRIELPFVSENPQLILIDNYKTFKYQEFIVIDKINKPAVLTLYDV